MSWIEHPRPKSAESELGRRLLRSSLTRNRGRLGRYAAMFTFPAIAEARTWMPRPWPRGFDQPMLLEDLHLRPDRYS